MTWGDFFDGNLLGTTAPAIQYVSPVFYGFQAATAWGGDDIWDAALRYSGQHGQMLIVAGIGYFSDRQEASDDPEKVEDRGWGGSIAARHVPTGLNLAFNYSTMGHTNNCDEPGAVSGRCRGDDKVYYITGGLERQFNSYGPTSFYGEYYRQTKRQNESEDDVLRALELNGGAAEELRGSTGTMWGFGVVQKFEAKKEEDESGNADAAATAFDKKRSETPLEIYIGYRHYSVDVDLIDGAGGVAGKRLKDFDAVVSGVTIRF